MHIEIYVLHILHIHIERGINAKWSGPTIERKSEKESMKNGRKKTESPQTQSNADQYSRTVWYVCIRSKNGVHIDWCRDSRPCVQTWHTQLLVLFHQRKRERASVCARQCVCLCRIEQCVSFFLSFSSFFRGVVPLFELLRTLTRRERKKIEERRDLKSHSKGARDSKSSWKLNRTDDRNVYDGVWLLRLYVLRMRLLLLFWLYHTFVYIIYIISCIFAHNSYASMLHGKRPRLL